MTEADVRIKLREWIGDRSQAQAARDIGISAPMLCTMLSGERVPCGKALDAIGIERRRKGPNIPLAFTNKSEH